MPSNIGPTEHHQFYGTGAGSGSVRADQSGNQDASSGASHIYIEDFAYGAPSTVMVAIRLEGSAGYIFSRYSGTTLQGIRYDGGTELQLVIANVVAQRIDTAVGVEIAVSWSMTQDPLSPANLRSEVRAWNVESGAFVDGMSWTHPAPAGLAGSDIIWGAQVVAGTNGTGSELRGAGYLLHGAGSVQVHRDRVSMAAAPTLTGETAMEHPMPSWSSNLGVQDRPAGPTHYLAAQAVSANKLMLVSPLVNVQWHAPTLVPWAFMQSSAWWHLAPDGDSFIGLPWTWRRPVPQMVSHVRPRVFIESGVAEGPDTTSTINITVWSCNRNPGQNSAIPLTSHSVTETFTDVAADSSGIWIDFDDLRISRTANGERTWLAVSIEASGVGAPNLGLSIHAVTIDPISLEETDALAEAGNG